METFVISHGKNEIIMTKDNNIKIQLEGEEKKVYRICFYEVENFDGVKTFIPIYNSDVLYNGWYCREDCDITQYPRKIFISIMSNVGWFADVIYDSVYNKFYRINTGRNTEILNKTPSPLLITGSMGGGTSYITKLLKHRGLYFGSDSGALENRKNHESLTFNTINDIVAFTENDFLYWFSKEGVEKIQKQMIERFNTFNILFRNHLEYRFENFWGDTTFDTPWAFKSPRISTILPLWLSIFPGARLLIINRNKKRISQTTVDLEGEWFRSKDNSFMVEHYFNPDVSKLSKNDVFRCDFNEIVKSLKAMNDMLKWVGLSELKDESEFFNFLKDTGYEGKIN